MYKRSIADFSCWSMWIQLSVMPKVTTRWRRWGRDSNYGPYDDRSVGLPTELTDPTSIVMFEVQSPGGVTHVKD